MRHLVKDISSSLSLKPDIVAVPKKSRKKGLKTSRAELLVPFKWYVNDKTNISNKSTSVAFYTLLVYNHGRCLQNKMCSSLWNVLPAACRATILTCYLLHLSPRFEISSKVKFFGFSVNKTLDWSIYYYLPFLLQISSRLREIQSYQKSTEEWNL